MEAAPPSKAAALPLGTLAVVETLSTSLSLQGTEVLNAANPEALSSVLVPTDGSVELRSDCDEQLLVTVPFKQLVKLHSLIVKGGSEGEQSLLGAQQHHPRWEARLTRRTSPARRGPRRRAQDAQTLCQPRQHGL